MSTLTSAGARSSTCSGGSGPPVWRVCLPGGFAAGGVAGALASGAVASGAGACVVCFVSAACADAPPAGVGAGAAQAASAASASDSSAARRTRAVGRGRLIVDLLVGVRRQRGRSSLAGPGVTQGDAAVEHRRVRAVVVAVGD